MRNFSNAELKIAAKLIVKLQGHGMSYAAAEKFAIDAVRNAR